MQFSALPRCVATFGPTSLQLAFIPGVRHSRCAGMYGNQGAPYDGDSCQRQFCVGNVASSLGPTFTYTVCECQRQLLHTMHSLLLTNYICSTNGFSRRPTQILPLTVTDWSLCTVAVQHCLRSLLPGLWGGVGVGRNF